MLNKIHEILRDPQCKGNIQCFILAVSLVALYICLLIYGLAWLGHDQAQINSFWKAENEHREQIGKATKRLDKLESTLMPSAFKGVPKRVKRGL